MIVRTLAEASATPRKVEAQNWNSVRLLLRADSMGFSFHITTIYAGTTTRMHYTNHLEAVYCIAGSGEIRELANGRTHAIAPGTLYALDGHDEHELTAHQELVLACVFNPPLHGLETHDASGSYPLEKTATSGQQPAATSRGG